MTEGDIIKNLTAMLQEANKGTREDTGACLFKAGSKTYCANPLTKAQCDRLHGTWVKDAKCPGT